MMEYEHNVKKKPLLQMDGAKSNIILMCAGQQVEHTLSS